MTVETDDLATDLNGAADAAKGSAEETPPSTH